MSNTQPNDEVESMKKFKVKSDDIIVTVGLIVLTCIAIFGGK